MVAENVHSNEGVTLVGAGNPGGEEIVKAVAIAPFVVAADGGANFCLAAGVRPAVVIGDFDSVTEDTRTALPEARFVEVTEQDSTDFEKCLNLIDAPFVLATGFTDGRVDHSLAALSALVQGLGPPTIIVGKDDLMFAAPAKLSLDLPAGTRVSLFPMQPLAGRSKGLRWTIDGLALDPMGRIGTSNEATGPVDLAFDGPGCIVLIPPAFLAEALTALTG